MLSDWGGRQSLGGIYPTLTILDGDWNDHEDEDGDGDDTDLGSQGWPTMTHREAADEVHSAKYFITVSRKNLLEAFASQWMFCQA